MSIITRFNHASYVVADLAVARGFYEGILGLSVRPERPTKSFDGIWYDLGDGQQIHLLVVPNPDAGIPRPEHGGLDRHIALMVNDWEEIIKRLETAGIPYTVSKSGRRALFCRDPDDNTLELISES